jgi:hypothetical protein
VLATAEGRRERYGIRKRRRQFDAQMRHTKAFAGVRSDVKILSLVPSVILQCFSVLFLSTPYVGYSAELFEMLHTNFRHQHSKEEA